jgi:hypothetical protein
LKKFIICNLAGEAVHVFDAKGYMYDPEDHTFIFFDDRDDYVATWIPVHGWCFRVLTIPTTAPAAPTQIH